MKALTLTDVEQFLYREAALLDAWNLDAWLALFDESGIYRIPNPGNPPEADPGEVVFFIADDRERLRGRIERLKKKNAHAEYPHSKTLHNVNNVQILEEDGVTIRVACNFVVFRNKNEITDIFFGTSKYLLKRTEDGFSVMEKVAELSFDSLRPQRMISFII